MKDILLETGTGELEIVEFMIEGQHYGINVLKVKGIVEISDISKLPNASEEVAGITNIRGELHTVIDLRTVLAKQSSDMEKKHLALLCEFNGAIVAFIVQRVENIKRIFWKDIKQTNEVRKNTFSIGSVLSNEKIITLLDFESIAIEAGVGTGYLQVEGHDIRDVKFKHLPIVLVEDSKVIGEVIKCSLEDSGYTDVKLFQNGQEAKNYIFALRDVHGEKFIDKIAVLITDIEMPVLDGYTLTKHIKQDPILSKLPVIIFSSLISRELEHKGIAVGADAQISKPSIKELIRVIEEQLAKICNN